jgi:hypothetical protein
MANKTTFRAIEDSLTEWHIHNVELTIAASMTTVSCLRIFSEFSTACDCFVGEHLIESAPRNVKDMFSEITLNHTINVQSLATNDTVFIPQGMSELVQEICPLIEDFQVLPGNIDSGFLSIPASFDSFGMNTLQFSQFPFCVNIESRINNTLSFMVCQELLEANINSNFDIGRMLNFRDINFTGEYSEPLSSFVLFDSQCFDFTFWYPMQYDWQTANLRHFQAPIVNELETRLGICHASDSGFEPRISWLDFDSFLSEFDSIKKILNGLMQPVRNILQDLAMSLGVIFGTDRFNIHHKAVEIICACKEMFFVFCKKRVPDFFTNFELIKKFDLLFLRGIQPEFIHFAEYHTEMILRMNLKRLGFSSSICIPLLKEVGFR